MLTSKYLQSRGLADYQLDLFKKAYPHGIVVDNDNIVQLRKLGIDITYLAAAIFNKYDLNLYRKLTAPTRAWCNKCKSRAEDKYDKDTAILLYDAEGLDSALKEMYTTISEANNVLCAIAASVFVRLYRKAYEVL